MENIITDSYNMWHYAKKSWGDIADTVTAMPCISSTHFNSPVAMVQVSSKLIASPESLCLKAFQHFGRLLHQPLQAQGGNWEISTPTLEEALNHCEVYAVWVLAECPHWDWVPVSHSGKMLLTHLYPYFIVSLSLLTLLCFLRLLPELICCS